jgi:hypothetical protein
MKKLDGERASISGQSSSQSRNREILARGARHEKVDCSNVVCSDLGKVAEVWDRRPVMREYRACKGFNFSERNRLPPEVMPRDGRGFDSAAYG